MFYLELPQDQELDPRQVCERVHHNGLHYILENDGQQYVFLFTDVGVLGQGGVGPGGPGSEYHK